ncbi:Uu.00g017530.m01.CDS01 [Anthostomella pinea]|uniref:Uu.00g017530.m01.CDS01 n=1 Tax=Anthostomella pinea TaxID=933095 RepID=A0AAI8VZK6_9PEZI|nr:Uu.00g017530.m01.CDS01 [Anthostomella pinea]
MALINRIVPFAAVLALLASSAMSIDMTYCASINTASGSGNLSDYQSTGLCHDFCVDTYAFAILQDSDCWCSNYEPDPSIQIDVDKCDQNCPGYPDDKCGGDGLWGYMLLDKAPAGTKGGETSTPTTTTPKQETTQAATTQATTTKQTSTEPTTPSVSIATVTEGGQVSLHTVTVMPTVTANPANEAASAGAGAKDLTSSPHGLSTGAAVGTAVGVLGAIVVMGILGVLFWLRRKRRLQEQEMADNPGSLRGSSAGMMGTSTTAMGSIWDGENMSMGRRSSRLMPHDPRMDPYTTNIYTRFDNKSHESVNTLQDNQDYSRKVLRTTNPDPPDGR